MCTSYYCIADSAKMWEMKFLYQLQARALTCLGEMFSKYCFSADCAKCETSLTSEWFKKVWTFCANFRIGTQRSELDLCLSEMIIRYYFSTDSAKLRIST